ncbi:MAG: hypothetical protein QGI60_01550 [archaeon]|jgi:hypothetical protein|nr:hypothetical protein [archaeon]
MHWFKKGISGAIFMIALFIVAMFLEIGNASIFSSGFIGFAGLVLFIGMGLFEINLITW